MTVTGPEEEKRARLLAERQINSRWRAPRPRGLPGLRDAVAGQLTSWESMPGFGGVEGTDPGAAMAEAALGYQAGRELRAQQRDLRDSPLYWIDGGVAIMAAQVAQVEHLAPHLERTERTYALRPESPPSRYGFMLWALPVAWISGTVSCEVVAVSWTPTSDDTLVGGGLDLTAWAPSTPETISGVRTSAGVEELPQLLLMRGRPGPLFPVTRVSWGHLQPATQHKHAASWLVAAHATWLAMGTGDLSVTALRPRRWRRGPRWEAEVRLFRVRWRREAVRRLNAQPD